MEETRIPNKIRPFHQPLWQGEALSGKVILLYAEQGFGDTIQFARFIPLVAERGATVIFEVQPGLERLMAEAPGVSTCLQRGGQLPPFDVHCPLLSLPLKLGLGQDCFIEPMEIRVPDRETTTTAGQVLLKVGLVWAGNPKHKRDALRSIPLPDFERLREVPGVSFTSLQMGVQAIREAERLTMFPMAQPCTPSNDFLDTANIIRELDVVIAVDTAVAHLAGSMRKAVWRLLPEAPDWRWGATGTTTPWYPEARLFRREGGQTWKALMEVVAAELELRATLQQGG